jgi:dTDP-4-amino-4,6-dideoxygalactose transaminase
VRVDFFRAERAYEAQQKSLRDAFDDVLRSGQLILGTQVEQFEREFAGVAGTADAVGVASGTDALELALRALELPPGSEVICPNLTALATATAIARAGLAPVFADVDPATLTLSVESSTSARSPRTSAIVAVHLYGRPAPVAALAELGVPVVEDCAQAHGLEVTGELGCFSFYPTKNLGGFGDGGAVATSNPELAERVRELRAYGAAPDGLSTEPGLNSRLDELQAALLRVRLRRLRDDNQRRAEIARTYDDALGRRSPPGVNHLYVVRSPRRNDLRHALHGDGIETLIHYPLGLRDHPAYENAPRRAVLEASEIASREVVSLPCYAHLSVEEEQYVGARLAAIGAGLEVR